MQELYCPHCDDFHPDNELIIDIEGDYIRCKKTNEEIKTYKYIYSEDTLKWRKEHELK